MEGNTTKNTQQSLYFRFDEEIKSFTEKQSLKEFRTSKPPLQQILKESL